MQWSPCASHCHAALNDFLAFRVYFHCNGCFRRTDAFTFGAHLALSPCDRLRGNVLPQKLHAVLRLGLKTCAKLGFARLDLLCSSSLSGNGRSQTASYGQRYLLLEGLSLHKRKNMRSNDCSSADTADAVQQADQHPRNSSCGHMISSVSNAACH